MSASEEFERAPVSPEKLQEEILNGNVEKIINLQKPAHTVYSLDLEVVNPDELDVKPVEEAVVQAVPLEEDDEITSQAAIWFKLDDE